jgi:hypothetical protein
MRPLPSPKGEILSFFLQAKKKTAHIIPAAIQTKSSLRSIKIFPGNIFKIMETLLLLLEAEGGIRLGIYYHAADAGLQTCGEDKHVGPSKHSCQNWGSRKHK